MWTEISELLLGRWILQGVMSLLTNSPVTDCKWRATGIQLLLCDRSLSQKVTKGGVILDSLYMGGIDWNCKNETTTKKTTLNELNMLRPEAQIDIVTVSCQSRILSSKTNHKWDSAVSQVSSASRKEAFVPLYPLSLFGIRGTGLPVFKQDETEIGAGAEKDR